MADRNAPMGASRLPWSRDNSEKIRFGSILALVLVVFLVPAALIPYLQLPEPERSEVEQIPPRLAQLVEAPRPVELEKPDVQSAPEPEPEPEDVEPAPTVAEPEPQSAPGPVETTSMEQTTEQARETAARSGLFAMRIDWRHCRHRSLMRAQRTGRPISVTPMSVQTLPQTVPVLRAVVACELEKDRSERWHLPGMMSVPSKPRQRHCQRLLPPPQVDRRLVSAQ